MQDIPATLKAHNLSVTATRLVILETIGRHAHADADLILNAAKLKIGTLSKQAVYDNLHLLTEKGLLRAIQPKGHPTLYETRVADNHHHLVCRGCGRTEDTHCHTLQAPCLTAKCDKGFAIDEAEVIFWGLCPKCQNEQSSK